MLSWFSIKTCVEVYWLVYIKSCLYHATYDGKTSLCGVDNLEQIRDMIIDPSDDLMTCLNCQSLVKRVK